MHAAGVIAGAELDPLRDLDARRVRAHLDAKYGGALALREAIAALGPERRPARVLLMSSVATLLGGVGNAGRRQHGGQTIGAGRRTLAGTRLQADQRR